MLFFTNKARKSAIENIDRLNVIIGQISGDQLSYIDAVEIGRYLDMLKNEIRIEMTKENN